jgi:hypothetical protein
LEQVRQEVITGIRAVLANIEKALGKAVEKAVADKCKKQPPCSIRLNGYEKP